jgi:hypothetical protein
MHRNPNMSAVAGPVIDLSAAHIEPDARLSSEVPCWLFWTADAATIHGVENLAERCQVFGVGEEFLTSPAQSQNQGLSDCRPGAAVRVISRFLLQLSSGAVRGDCAAVVSSSRAVS